MDILLIKSNFIKEVMCEKSVISNAHQDFIQYSSPRNASYHDIQSEVNQLFSEMSIPLSTDIYRLWVDLVLRSRLHTVPQSTKSKL